MTEPMASNHQRKPTRCAFIRISDIWICFEFVISDFEFPYQSIATVLSRPFLNDSTSNSLQVINQCFSRDSLVATPIGPKSIGEIEPGELVFAHDFKFGESVAHPVSARYDSHFNGPLVAIPRDNGPVRSTVYHPFWVVRG